MNYAALLAVVVLLTFFFPLSIRVASLYGVSPTVSGGILTGALIFVLATSIIRWQVLRYRHLTARLETARNQISAQPQSPRAYFVEGEHLVTTLLRVGRRREAAEVADRYAELSGVPEVEIVALREAIAQTAKKQRHSP